MTNSFVQKVWSVFFLLILPLSFPCEKEIAAASESRPNILFIITDDQERREFNFLEEGRTEQGQPRNLSPHLDRLAHEGVVFPNQYVTSPVCTPSRFSVLTGNYASRSASFQRTVDRGEQVN
ncbi:MAG: sulfatase-like hydrolase/transferase, partial [Pirellulales bacterium]